MKYVVIIPLMLLLAGLATMLPLRPGFKELAREIMRARMSETSADAIIIADVAIPAEAWDGTDEFRLQGALYDVVSVIYKDGRKYYRCLSDNVEVALEEEADALVSAMSSPAPSTPQGKIAKALTDWLNHLYKEEHPQQQLKHFSLYCGPIFPAPVTLARAPELAWPPKPPEA